MTGAETNIYVCMLDDNKYSNNIFNCKDILFNNYRKELNEYGKKLESQRNALPLM